MGNRLAGRVALVSGSTRGIGRTIAETFAAEGAKVAVTGRTVEKGQKVVDLIRSNGGEAEFFQLDVTNEQSVHDTVEAVVARFGSLTTLINNAAPTTEVSTTVKPLHEYSTEEWNGIITSALTGNVFWASKYAWPHLAAAGQFGQALLHMGQALGQILILALAAGVHVLEGALQLGLHPMPLLAQGLNLGL